MPHICKRFISKLCEATRRPAFIVFCGWLLVVVTACTSATQNTLNQQTAAPPAGTAATPMTGLRADASGLRLPAGFRAEVYASGLHQPTAMAFGPDQRLYVSQLNGDENAGAGEVVALDQPQAAPRVVLDHLAKPTGLVWRGTDLYIASGRNVLQTRADAQGKLSTSTPVVRDLGFNSRSEGQIDLLPDGRLLFEASGSIGDAQSGRLFTLMPGGTPDVLATGLKNAYGHAVDPATGQLYTTEIGDDSMDGKAPPEEINAVAAGSDYGWPRCYDAQTPATDRGGTAAICAATQKPIVAFPPHSTPTGLTFYAGKDFPPAYSGVLYVALWNGNPPQVLRVTLRQENGAITGTANPFLSGIQAIDLLPDPRGGLLVLDYAGGVVYRIVATVS